MENISKLEQEIMLLRQELAAKNNSLQEKNNHIKILEEYILSLKQKQFGSSSEKLSPTQTELFDEADGNTAEIEADNATPINTLEIPAHTRSTKRRVSIPADIPRVDIIHDLPDDQKICPHDGTALKRIGSENHVQLDIIPAKVQALNHIRYKYACPCCEKYLLTATKPAQPIEKSIASPGLLAYITTQKYVDALPLYRQVEIFKRIGVEMDRGTLASWMTKCGQLVQPLINLVHEKILAQDFLHMDETRVQVLSEPNKTAQSNSYMWVLRSTLPTASAVLFRYEPTRSGDVAKELLRDFTGALMVDGYEGYSATCIKNAITRLGCWAHARRKFIEAQQAQPKGKTGKADQALAYIQQLYRIEQLIKDKTTDEKYQARQQQSQPILDKLKSWLDKSLSQVPPKTALGKALYYLDSQWLRLINYVQHGDYPIDNNAAENAIRPFVIGRKNWLFSASQKGATSSANLYSLIETAKANGLEPYSYLKRIFADLPNVRTVEQIENLLPWNLTINE
jgi:transposase